MKHLKIIVFAVLALFSISYAFLLRDYISSHSLSFIDNVIANFISTLLSIIVGIYLFEYQENDNRKSEIERLTSIVNAESKHIVSVLSEGESMDIILQNGEMKKVLITFISPLAHEEAGKSGLYNSIATENLFHISCKIRMYNLKVEHLLGLIRISARDEFITHAIKNVNETITSIIEGCKLVLNQVKKA